jgi:DNA-binding beta-propeller fold protein YncE
MRPAAFAAGLLLLASSCTEITEYSTTGEYGVTVLDASDLAVIGTLEGLPNASLIVSMGGASFAVLSSDGNVYHCDSEALSVDSISNIPAVGGGGFRDAVKLTGSLYLLAGGPNLLEVSLQSFAVLDEFVVGTSPVDMCASPSGVGLLYLVDSGDGMIREVSTMTNSVNWAEPLRYVSPAAVAAYLAGPPRLVVGYADSAASVSFLDLDVMYESRFDELVPYPAGRIITHAADSVLYVSRPIPGYDGYLEVYWGYGEWGLPSRSTQLNGSPVDIAVDPAGGFAYVLTDVAEAGAAVYRLQSDSANFAITDQLELEGVPLDVSSHGSGAKLLVLTAR